MRLVVKCFVLALIVAIGPSRGFTQPSVPPNVVLILADDLGYGDLQCYGHRDLQTPHLDRLASEGLQLNHFYAPSPLCSPSRAGLLTGRTPFRTGIKSWIPQNDNIYLRQEEMTIARLLKDQGYRTFLGGKWHLNGGLELSDHPQPHDLGFDHWLATHNFTLPTHKDPHNFYRNGQASGPQEGFAAQIVVNEALDWLAGLPPASPFFMFISLHEPHSEIASPDSFNILYQQFTKARIDLDNLSDRGPGEYYANISHMDYQIGRLLDGLKTMGHEDNTLVIFTSDNGPVTREWRYWWEVNLYGETGGLRGRKADLFDGGIRVPCIMRYPPLIRAGSQSDLPLHGYDLLPTICALTGTPLPADRILDGEDFSPIFTQGSFRRHQPLFWAFEIRSFDDPSGYYYAARQGPWKLITDRKLEKALLYNLTEDPYEVRDRSQSNPEQLAALKTFISRMAASIASDPLRPQYQRQSKE